MLDQRHGSPGYRLGLNPGNRLDRLRFFSYLEIRSIGSASVNAMFWPASPSISTTPLQSPLSKVIAILMLLSPLMKGAAGPSPYREFELKSTPDCNQRAGFSYQTTPSRSTSSHVSM